MMVMRIYLLVRSLASPHRWLATSIKGDHTTYSPSDDAIPTRSFLSRLFEETEALIATRSPGTIQTGRSPYPQIRVSGRTHAASVRY